MIPLADANQGGDLLDRIVMIRRQLALELGLVIPVVRIRDNIALQPNEYRLKLKETKSRKASFSSITFWRCLRQAKTIRSKGLTQSNRPSVFRLNGYRNLRKIRPKCSGTRLSIRLQSYRPILQSR
ncbi:FHIPEP family type III secretion protein [Bacillus licheniformis]|nr:FHIPEP family type III secretion protein [Bacillus licheniformis]